MLDAVRIIWAVKSFYYVFISAFIICWMPYVLAGLLNHFAQFGYGGWFDILTALSPLNSVLNPIIFLMFNHRMFKPAMSYKYSRTVETRA
jgi:hypothetical protein